MITEAYSHLDSPCCSLPLIREYCPVMLYESLVQELNEGDRQIIAWMKEDLNKAIDNSEDFILNNLEPFYRLFSEEQNYSL